MGICFSHLPFYDLCHAQNAIRSPLFVLGSQQIHETREDIREFARRHGYADLLRDMNVRSLFRERYAVGDYRDCDLNRKADLALDLGLPIPESFLDGALAVLNAGTIEHVFDVGRAFRNIHQLTRPGGVIIHIAPLTWYEHGYYNFNPRIFGDVARANAYRPVAEAFHFGRDVLGEGNLERPALYVTFDGISFTPSREKIWTSLRGDAVAANILYMVAYRKTGASEFVYPYDVQG